MGVFSDIHNALNTQLASISGLPDIYFPNSSKEPSQGTAYLRPTLLPAISEIYTLSNENSHQGLYQIDIFVPLKAGIAAANNYADIIRESFNRARLKTNNTIVQIQQISISQNQRIESWWSCYVEVGYFCVA